MKYIFRNFIGALLLTLFFLTPLKSFDMELRGLFQKPQFSGLNDYHADIFSYSFSIDVQASKINEMAGIELLLGIPVGGGFAICACLSLGMNEYTDILFDEYHKKTAVQSVARFITGFAGIGCKYFLDAGMERFKPYLFYNVGVFKHLDSRWTVTADPAYYFVNSDYEYQKISFTDIFPGMNFEIGFDWRVLDFIGLVSFIGYKYGIFKLEFPDEGLFAEPHYQDTDVDISGMYFGGGLKFYFDKFESTKNKEPQKNWSYYNIKGDEQVKSKNYKSAIENYLNAIRLYGPENIYKKIFFCFYKLNDIKMAVYYAEKYLEFFPQDIKIKNWVEKNK